jgi:hypothetical protein
VISASAVDSHALLQLLWSAPAASLLTCVCFALALRGFSSASEARRAGRPASALIHTVAAAVPMVMCVAAVAGAALVLIRG